MPISGVVIRLVDDARAERLRAELAGLSTFELGECYGAALAGVIDAPDYAAHDAALNRLGEMPGVCAVDIVFHEFSDVSEFPRLPKKQRNAR